MNLLTRDEVVSRIAEIPDNQMRYSVLRLLTEYKAMGERLDALRKQREGATEIARFNTPQVDERARIRRRGPFGAILSD